MPDVSRWRDHAGPLIDFIKGFEIIECELCGFKHVVPIPGEEELATIYRDEYYSLEKPFYLDWHQEDLPWWNTVYQDRYQTFEDNLPGTNRRILDVGSGPGFFLLHGKERGWDVLGVEPSSQAAAHARGLGLDIMEGFFDEQVASCIGKFDVVHMSEVLEHIPDPRKMLRLAYGVLNPGGLIAVIAPNDYNPFQCALRTMYGYEPWWVTPPHHINYFDFASLSRLLEVIGFQIISREATFPMEMFLLMGDHYVGNESLGRECHGKRKRFKQRLVEAGLNGVKRNLYMAFAENNLGREVSIVATRNA